MSESEEPSLVTLDEWIKDEGYNLVVEGEGTKEFLGLIFSMCSVISAITLFTFWDNETYRLGLVISTVLLFLFTWFLQCGWKLKETENEIDEELRMDCLWEYEKYISDYKQDKIDAEKVKAYNSKKINKINEYNKSNLGEEK